MQDTKEENKYLTLIEKNKENIFIRLINRFKLLFMRAKKIEDIENEIEMIIFDLDGTLWDTEDVSYDVVTEIVKKYDFIQKINKETIAKTMGCTFEETAEMFMPYLEKEKREEILKEMLDMTAEKLKVVGGNLYGGLEKVLIELKKKYKLAIVSNCAAGYIESFLDSSKLRKYFDDFAAAGKMKVTKSEAIKAVVERNNIIKAVYVGDTIKDLEASQGVKMDFIQAKYGFGQDLKTKYSINELAELPSILKNIT